MKENTLEARISVDESTSLFAFHISLIRSYNKLLTMKTTKIPAKTKSSIEKCQKKESVEAIYIISSSLKTLYKIHWTVF